MSGGKMVKLTELWQRKSAKGDTYFSGFLGSANVLLFKEGEKDHPTKPGEKVIAWSMMIAERQPRNGGSS